MVGVRYVLPNLVPHGLKYPSLGLFNCYNQRLVFTRTLSVYRTVANCTVGLHRCDVCKYWIISVFFLMLQQHIRDLEAYCLERNVVFESLRRLMFLPPLLIQKSNICCCLVSNSTPQRRIVSNRIGSDRIVFYCIKRVLRQQQKTW